MSGLFRAQLGEGKDGIQELARREQRQRGWQVSGGLQAVWRAGDPRPRQEVAIGKADVSPPWSCGGTSPSQRWRGELSPGRKGSVHWHLDLANNQTCHGQAHQVGTYLASSLIISYASATVTLKPQAGLPPACSWACYFAPKAQPSTAPYSRNAGCGPPSR